MNQEPILIAIVDDHTLFRNGVSALMNEFNDLRVIFEAGSVLQMQQMLIHSLEPQVILMDINMPVTNGCDGTIWLKKMYPQIKVLALSMFEDDMNVIKMIKCGACGYVVKESKPVELLEAIKTVHLRGVYINEMVSGKLFRSVIHNEDGRSISNREEEFLKLCCSEMTYKEISEKMFVSPRTVDNYRESLFAKLQLKSRTGLVIYAIQNQIFKV